MHFGPHKSKALPQRFAAEVSGPLMADRGARPNIIYVEMLAQHCNSQNSQWYFGMKREEGYTSEMGGTAAFKPLPPIFLLQTAAAGGYGVGRSPGPERRLGRVLRGGARVGGHGDRQHHRSDS